MTVRIVHLLATVAALTLGAPARAEDCSPPPLGRTVPFSAGEYIEMDVDSLGATIAKVTVLVDRGHGNSALVLTSHARTGTFASNFHSLDATGRSFLSRSLVSQRYQEDSTEDGVRKSLEYELPPAGSTLALESTREGKRDDFKIETHGGVRDLLSALYSVRTLPLAKGAKFCLPVIVARKAWTMQMSVGDVEPVSTSAGDFKTIHVTAMAVRNDDASVRREVHLWYSEDAAHVPVAAFASVQGKPVRAQLVQYTPGRASGRGGKR